MRKLLTTLIVALIVLAVLLVGVITLLLLHPHVAEDKLSEAPLSVSVTTVKVDAEGNELGTATLGIDGSIIESRSKGKYLDATFADFDGMRVSNSVINEPDGVVGKLQRFELVDFSHVYVSVIREDGTPGTGTVAFSPDLDYWLFSNSTDGYYYYGSVSGKATTQELIEYFAPFGLKNTLS